MTVLMRDIIEHYGVKGMRWGVRKKRGRPLLDPHKRAQDKNPDDMTTAELKALVEDMRLRQQYNSIVGSESAKSGSSWVGKQLERTGSTFISVANQAVATMVVNNALASYAARKAARTAARAAGG